ncbi:MAG TPA: hypothetical protein PK562_05530, partial [Candidatus Omnitrophota bacterium]|nr:hypothetical protein [Candidatus Omnitrophota bacterium]
MEERTVKRRGFAPRILIIGAIMAGALLLRLPQLDFPSIGYHNMKENEYISMAQHMLKTGDLIGRHVYFYNAFSENSDFNLYPQIPFVSYQILAGYKLFGDSLWFPRLINILLMLAAFLCLYRIAGLLGLSLALRLAVLFLLAVMPLGVFFARNLQAESGAFFAMCCGSVMGLHFIRSGKKIYLILFSLSLALTAAYKIAFLIGFAAVFFLVPFRQYARSRRACGIAEDMAILGIPLAVFIIYCYLTGQTSFSSTEGRVMLWRPFTLAYWRQFGPIIRHYAINENFTFIYSVLAAAGMILAWVRIRTDRSMLAAYIRIWSVLIIPYIMVFNDYINQHNYYQMPFLGLAVFACVYCLESISRASASFLRSIRQTHVFAIAFFTAFAVAVPGIFSAVRGHFGVIFPGADAVGIYLAKVMEPEEKFLIYTTSQGYAPCVYARKRCGWPDSLGQLKRIEAQEHIRYAVVYPFGFIRAMPPDMKEYIMGSYHVDSLGFVAAGDRVLPQAVVLKKGGTADIDAFIRDNIRNAKMDTVYRTLQGDIPFFMITAGRT